MFTVPSGGTWSTKYTDFRGKTYDIGSVGFQNQFIKVNTSAVPSRSPLCKVEMSP
jgi:hypothetical protein